MCANMRKNMVAFTNTFKNTNAFTNTFCRMKWMQDHHNLPYKFKIGCRTTTIYCTTSRWDGGPPELTVQI